VKRRWRVRRWQGNALLRLTLEGRALLAMALSAVAVGADVGRTEVHVLVLAILALLLASLLFTPAYRLRDIAVEVMAPPRVTVGEELVITVVLHNDGARAYRALRVEVPRWHPGGRFTARPPELDMLEPGQRRSALVRGRFARRGQHQVAPLRVLSVLPLGLAQGPALITRPVQFAAVPRVANVVSMTTPEGRRHQPGGVALASRTGDATELLGVRPYRPGDPVRDLHARSWARHGAPMVREYQEAYFTRIGVIIDTDASVTTPAHFEAGLSLAAGIVAQLCAGEALVDVLIAGAAIERLALGRSVGSFERVLDALAVVEPGPPFSADLLMAELEDHVERLSSVVLVALTEGHGRAALAAAIRARGVSCVVVVVGDATGQGAASTTVGLGAIVQGAAIAL
jgi:uncharacterized protein (DUF58 family)